MIVPAKYRFANREGHFLLLFAAAYEYGNVLLTGLSHLGSHGVGYNL